MATDFLISFDDLKAGSAAVKRLVQAFTRAGATVASSDIDPKTRRTSGVNYRQVLITFTDNQKVLLGVKTTGDIFEVRVNGAALAIKNQDNQIKAVGEIAKALDAGRAKFQAKMARTKVALPKGITTAAPKMELRLQEAEATLDQEIAAAKARVAELRAEIGAPVMDSTHEAAGEKFNGGEWDTLVAMKQVAKVEDGDVPSKASRDSLAERGFVERGDGMNWLTEKGKEVAAALGSVPYQGMKRTAFASAMTDNDQGKVRFCLSDGYVWEVSDIGAFKTTMKAESTGEAFKLLQGSKQYRKVAALGVLDAVDVPCSSFDDAKVIDAQVIAARLAAGDTLDDADLSHARATLENALDTVETNHPINVAEGNIAQAELEEKAAESFRAALKILGIKEPLAA